MPSRIGIDATPLDTSHRFRGIGTYVRGLLDGLEQCDRDLPLVQLRFSRGRDLHRSSIETLDVYRPRWPRTRLRWLLEEFLLPRAIRRTGATAFHATDPRTIPRKADRPLIATAYDLIPLVFPDQYLASFPWDERLSYQLCLRRYREADHVIAISEATKRDLVHYLGIDPGLITVTPLAYDAELFRPVPGPIPPEHGIPSRYFLYVGAHDPRKNIEYMLRAFAPIRRQVPEKFVFAGKLTREEAARFAGWITELGLTDQVVDLGFAPNELLPTLYANATALVFPSLYEGFGLTPLEAIACGCPVVVARASAVPEVVGDAGFLFDPEDPAILSELLTRLSHDQALGDDYRSRGLARAAGFTWKQCAEQTLAVYRRFAG